MSLSQRVCELKINGLVKQGGNDGGGGSDGSVGRGGGAGRQVSAGTFQPTACQDGGGGGVRDSSDKS